MPFTSLVTEINEIIGRNNVKYFSVVSNIKIFIKSIDCQYC